ncbi:hypothetical protein BU26DRAFT_113609 [Trematosphaeria pertusa]|uniref:Uncharacterized protein n=1 Tax=Trematosphaeria pertusa TaxID=390896 RepID=A0A6A6HZT3_9PLEO|nr:uncharacterized protein BU26DRAFT_113609 [Trematosphaeria pertusa]KAF2243232.1 hypothetical protein BU26DRAFT_113609 [Trematosphaeria pertusa]
MLSHHWPSQRAAPKHCRIRTHIGDVRHKFLRRSIIGADSRSDEAARWNMLRRGVVTPSKARTWHWKRRHPLRCGLGSCVAASQGMQHLEPRAIQGAVGEIGGV